MISRVEIELRCKRTDLDEIWSNLKSTLSGTGPGRFCVRSVQQQQLESQAKFFFVS